jgi:hypothetical protein
MADFAKEIETAAQRLAVAVKTEMEMEDNRHNVKFGAIGRIMSAGDNPLTGKPHSFSSAEAGVHGDSQYADYLAQLRIAVENRILARGSYDAALARARLSNETK